MSRVIGVKVKAKLQVFFDSEESCLNSEQIPDSSVIFSEPLVSFVDWCVSLIFSVTCGQHDIT